MAAAGLSLSRRRRPRWLDRLLVNAILLAGLVGVFSPSSSWCCSRLAASPPARSALSSWSR